MRRRRRNSESTSVNNANADTDIWVVIAEADDHAAAKSAAQAWLAARGVAIYPWPGRKSMGAVGVRDTDLRVDLFCGRHAGPSSTRISIRKSALDAVTTPDP